MNEKREGLIKAAEVLNKMNTDAALKAATTNNKAERRKLCLAMVHCETSLASIRKKMEDEGFNEKSDSGT